MTVSTQITKRIYEGNGITRQWDIDFPLMAADDLRVYVTSDQGEETEITTGFSINVARTQLEYPTAQSGLEPLADGEKITLVRQTPLTQGIDLIRQGELDAEVLEQGYYKLTLAVQELNEKVDRSIKYPVSTQPISTETENFLKDILAAKQAAVDASSSAVTAAQAASSSAQSAQQVSIAAQGRNVGLRRRRFGFREPQDLVRRGAQALNKGAGFFQQHFHPCRLLQLLLCFRRKIGRASFLTFP